MEDRVRAASLISWVGIGVAIIAALMWATRRYATRHPKEPHMKATDPVCGMTLEADQAVAKVEYGGKTYHFCSETCHKRFAAEPAKYASPPERGPSGHH